MAALRISRPGVIGTTLIDLGPSVGRVTHTRGAIYGGAIVVAAKVPVDREAMRAYGRDYYRRNTAAELERQRRKREARRERELAGDPRPNQERCGKPLRVVGEPCARIAGHLHDCRSRYALDNALRMKTGRGL